MFDESYINYYLEQIWEGFITKSNLSVEYHEQVGIHLFQAAQAGFGGFAAGGFEAESFDAIRENIYVFSAAKQYQQVRVMSNFINLLPENSSFTDFKLLAKNVFDEFNTNWLETEFRTAKQNAQNARQWVDIEAQKKILPMLRYNTQRDARVRPEHAAIDGVTLPVDDPFWNSFMPANGWNCRCFVTQHTISEYQPTPPITLEAIKAEQENFPELFQFNPGKKKMVFDDAKHPYFKVAKGDAELKKNNFNLPIL